MLASYLGVQPDSLDTTASVFDAASAQNIGLMLINPDNPTVLDALAISAQAKARISTALSLGNSVVVPTQPVSLNGTATIAWYEINPQTGEVVGVTEDGGHQGILLGLTAFQLAVLGIGAGVVVGGEIAIVVDCVFKAAFDKYYPEINSGFSQAQAQSDANAYFVQCVIEENKNIPPFIIAMGKVLLNAVISFGISIVHKIPPPPPPPPPKPPHRAGSAPIVMAAAAGGVVAIRARLSRSSRRWTSIRWRRRRPRSRTRSIISSMPCRRMSWVSNRRRPC